MGRYDKYKDEYEAKKARDEEIKKNQAAWREANKKGDEAGMAAAHEAQKEHIGEFDSYIGGTSSFDPEKGTWNLSDGERTTKDGAAGNSFLNRYYSRAASRGAKEFDDAYDKYRSNTFSYDPSKDPDYEIYKREYKKAGLEAMDDALARSAARTGGVASSYAVTAGAQAYNGYMSRLADKIPELRKLAYEKYLNEQEQYLKRLALARQMTDDEEDEYDKNRAAYLDYRDGENEKDLNYSAAMVKAQTGGFSSLSDSDIHAIYESGSYYDPETNRIKASSGEEFALPDEETEKEEDLTPVSAALIKFRYKGTGISALSDSDIEALLSAGYSFDGTNWIAPDGEATSPLIKTAAKKSSSSKSTKSSKSKSGDGKKTVTKAAMRTAKNLARRNRKTKIIKSVTEKNKKKWVENKKIDPKNYTPGKALIW